MKVFCSSSESIGISGKKILFEKIIISAQGEILKRENLAA